MANLNLSEFTEKLFVADADHTFIWDSAMSISKRVSRNSWLNSGTLTSDAPVTISQTWNQIGTAFTALKVNAVSTASATGSLLLDLQLGGATKFKVDKASVATLGVSAGADNSALYFGGANYSISLTRHATGLDMGVGGDNRISFGLGVGQILLSGRSSLAWSDGNVTNTGTVDTILLRDGAANTLALRNGAAAQTFNVYGTYTSGSVYERMFMRYNGTDLAFQVGAETLGATARPLQLWTGGASRLHVTTAGNVGIGTTSPTSKLHVVGGNILADNYIQGQRVYSYLGTSTYAGMDTAGMFTNTGVIGFSANTGVNFTNSCDTFLVRDGEAYHLATRNGTNGQKFSVYGTYPGAAWERFTITAPTSGNVLLGTYKGTGGIARGLEFQTDGVTRMTISTGGDVNLSNALVFGGSGQFRFLSSGVAFLTNAAQTDFGRLCLGGNTASAPALKRSTTYLQARLADDSAFTNIQGKLTTDTDYTAGSIVPTGFLTLYDAQGNAYKVPCVAA